MIIIIIIIIVLPDLIACYSCVVVDNGDVGICVGVYPVFVVGW